jgi:predicted phage terminase large subunit-like protein
MVRGKMSFTATCNVMRTLTKRWPLARRKIVEDKANGTAVINALSSEIAGIVPINPEGGKESRAAAVQPEVESGNVYLPDGAPWLHDFISELGAFPLGKNDDIVDSVSQALTDMHASPDVARAHAMVSRL